ncbi:hypothetical protein NDU88_001830 [Pleurodeles waltl]|uniref:Uncharacterized protein n=1 Tax=Pleurodeles waltl TaxID=8319 RepID=A0AAV7TJU2_PLEWA|nr:hypothetical protein NDU88_001830 [Pleurodeles waltl]
MWSLRALHGVVSEVCPIEEGLSPFLYECLEVLYDAVRQVTKALRRKVASCSGGVIPFQDIPSSCIPCHIIYVPYLSPYRDRYECLEVLYDAVRQVTKALRRKVASCSGGVIPFQDIPSSCIPCHIIYVPYLSPYRDRYECLEVLYDAVRQVTKALRRKVASCSGGVIPFQDIPSSCIPCHIIYVPYLSPYRDRYECLEVLYDAVRQVTKALRRKVASCSGGVIPFQDIPSSCIPCHIIYVPYLSPYRDRYECLEVLYDAVRQVTKALRRKVASCSGGVIPFQDIPSSCIPCHIIYVPYLSPYRDR